MLQQNEKSTQTNKVVLLTELVIGPGDPSREMRITINDLKEM